MYSASSIKRVVSRTATSSSRFMSFKPRNVVVVEGCRIPFTMAGSVYGQYLAVDLARFALKGLLTKTALDPKLIDYLYYGTVIQEARTSNIAREAAMGAGIPISVPSNTISMACISANQAITAGAEKIMAGQADIVVAGGVETFSDVPIRFSRPIRQRMLGNHQQHYFCQSSLPWSKDTYTHARIFVFLLLFVNECCLYLCMCAIALPKAAKKGPMGYLGLLKVNPFVSESYICFLPSHSCTFMNSH